MVYIVLTILILSVGVIAVLTAELVIYARNAAYQRSSAYGDYIHAASKRLENTISEGAK